MMTERPDGITPSQTVGPFFHYGLTPGAGPYPIAPLFSASTIDDGAAGDRIVIVGRLIDGDGDGVPDGMIEIWQADETGVYAHPGDGRARSRNNFTGFARAATDSEGRFAFTTIRPGRVPGPGGGLQAPHVAVTIFARGMLTHLVTRLYFPDEPSNAEDPVLTTIPAERRGTLIAERADGAGRIRFDIRLQGDGETVFFAI